MECEQPALEHAATLPAYAAAAAAAPAAAAAGPFGSSCGPLHSLLSQHPRPMIVPLHTGAIQLAASFVPTIASSWLAGGARDCSSPACPPTLHEHSTTGGCRVGTIFTHSPYPSCCRRRRRQLRSKPQQLCMTCKRDCAVQAGPTTRGSSGPLHRRRARRLYQGSCKRKVEEQVNQQRMDQPGRLKGTPAEGRVPHATARLPPRLAAARSSSPHHT